MPDTKTEDGKTGFQEEFNVGQQLHDMYEAGNAGLNKISDHIRKNPVASLLIAFGMGYAISKIMGQGK